MAIPMARIPSEHERYLTLFITNGGGW